MPAFRPLLAVYFTTLVFVASCSGPGQQPPLPASVQKPAPPSNPPPAAPPMPTPVPPAVSAAVPAIREVATLGNGCFWCTEAVLERLDGVIDVTSGYAGGEVLSPTYDQVCSGTTGHAEVVQVTFDPARMPYAKLLEWFFMSHDPTTLNRQGNDEGTQYRSVIFFHSEAQKAAALAGIATAQKGLRDQIVTEVSPVSRFWPAETYHQDFFRSNPTQGYCRALIAPKLKKLGLDKPPK